METEYEFADIRGVLSDIATLDGNITLPAELTIGGLIEIRNAMMRGHFERLQVESK